MLKRKNSPNKGMWSPPGGKLKMNLGESPFECAIREAKEETNLDLISEDLSLFGYVSEKGYEGECNWLMFLFDCKKIISAVPNEFNEGSFDFFSRNEINNINIPESDHELIWPFYDSRSSGLWGVSADCSNQTSPKIKIEACPI